MSKTLFYIAILAISLIAPFAFPDYKTQLATLWLMIIVSLTWDMTGGQMGYNSLGNIFFYGAGMYVAGVFGIGIAHDVGAYNNAFSGDVFKFTPTEYFVGLFVGSLLGGVFCSVSALILGYLLFGLRGPYFAIGTLGVAVAAGELVANWEWIGGGQGISLPVYPYDLEQGKDVFYFMFMGVGVALFAFLAWLYNTKFGAAINAIRDDEEKAEGLGIDTLRYKLFTWAIAAFFVGIAGGISGYQLIHFEPLESAFQTINLGIFMVVCALLGGKGTLWGPVVGAILFHVFKEVTWNYLLGWQWVALGALIVVTVVYFQEGIVGWVRRQKPEWFGIVVEEDTGARAKPTTGAQPAGAAE
ncbi:branched-chain amino acid ABC transporter permease [Dichotomicrobium thermohalophilum]|uniref:Amino acid/amide ABC transporter membrane protein 2 (HAAT family) n=1 Tax=Dichotomicrobium thermohalophilum TaxID=933063 RepID=A0A397QCF2_9HYPH|nr:branched-chain amino acid ABC transporter permease [Dichotomicrobium thermohalophilum]RIA55931.1 amino acid/amide ABC transporter membrane protein 2 (HAAT family) [Dichotomicrobium thermohalophilum]